VLDYSLSQLSAGAIFASFGRDEIRKQARRFDDINLTMEEVMLRSVKTTRWRILALVAFVSSPLLSANAGTVISGTGTTSPTIGLNTIDVMYTDTGATIGRGADPKDSYVIVGGIAYKNPSISAINATAGTFSAVWTLPQNVTFSPKTSYTWTLFLYDDIINNALGPSISSTGWSYDHTDSTGTSYYGPNGALTGAGTPYTDSVSSVTPLPAALPLFASGLGVMGFLARRRKKQLKVAQACNSLRESGRAL